MVNHWCECHNTGRFHSCVLIKGFQIISETNWPHSGCTMSNYLFVAIAVGLMLYKICLWLAVVRFEASLGASAVYVATTLLMLWSYWRAMFVLPLGRRAVDGKVRDADATGADQAMRYCERCDDDKPAFVHHCSACKRCIYRMVRGLRSVHGGTTPTLTLVCVFGQDHHCPWTNNCVGWDNKKYFLLFLVYTSASCLSFAAMVTPLVLGASNSPSFALRLGWVLALAVGGLLAGYFTFHAWLLYEGKTTLEFLSGRPGELAGLPLLHNVKVYFGANAWSWWLPTTPAGFQSGYSAVGSVDRSRDEERPKYRELVV